MIRHSSLLLLPGHTAIARCSMLTPPGLRVVRWIKQDQPENGATERPLLRLDFKTKQTNSLHSQICFMCFMLGVKLSNHPIFWGIYRSIFAECILASYRNKWYLASDTWMKSHVELVRSSCPFRFLRICWLFKAALIHPVAPSAQMERSSKTVEETSLCMPKWNVNWYCLILLLHKTQIIKGCCQWTDCQRVSYCQ